MANLHKQLDQNAQQAGNLDREQDAARSFIKQTYPALVRNRLRGKHEAVVLVGSPTGNVPLAVSGMLTDAGGQQLRLRVIKVPVDGQQIDKMLAAHPEVGRFKGPGRLEALGRALGAELAHGGDTPLWKRLHRRSGRATGRREQGPGRRCDRRAYGQASERRDEPLPAGALLGPGLGGRSGRRGRGERHPPIGRPDLPPGRPLYRWTTSTRQAGRLSLALLLAGAPSGQYGLKQSADDFLPALQGFTATGG